MNFWGKHNFTFSFLACNYEAKLELIFLSKSQIKDYKIGICCFSAMYATLMIKSKDWLAQINVSNWSDMSTCLHNNNKNPTKLAGLVQSRYYYHLVIQLKNCSFKEYLKLLNRLYDITWFGSVYA